LPKNNESLHNR